MPFFYSFEPLPGCCRKCNKAVARRGFRVLPHNCKCRRR